MGQKVAIIGSGPAGCMTACNLSKSFEITLFDKSKPLKTLLPTGGGRCNLAHAEFNFKELAKNYPRGEKFLYSLFSRFGTQETLDFFEKIGIKTYTQENGRIFPISNSAQDVRNAILSKLHHCKFKEEEIVSIKKLEHGFEVKSTQASYYFDIVVVAIGGKSSYKMLSDLGHTIIEPKPSLVGLVTEPNYKVLQGISLQNVLVKSGKTQIEGDILFTDNGITGPAIFDLSSINARKDLPYEITIDFLNKDIDWQNLFDKNPHKELKNIVSEFLPKAFVNEILKNIDLTQKGHEIKSNTKVLVNNTIRNFKIKIINTRKNGETVTAGGVLLKEIDSKTLQSRFSNGLYICGEVLDIDGFCGGYNLQNCWSTGYITAIAINCRL